MPTVKVKLIVILKVRESASRRPIMKLTAILHRRKTSGVRHDTQKHTRYVIVP